MEICKKCGVEKSLDDFYRSPGIRDFHRIGCKTCNLAEMRHLGSHLPIDDEVALIRERARQLRRPA